MKELITIFEKFKSEERRIKEKIIDYLLENYSKELFGYPPNFEKKIRGKEVDLDKLTELFKKLFD